MANDTYTVNAEGKVYAGMFAPAAYPVWRQGLTPLAWAPVVTNLISQLDPANDPDINPNFPGSAPWRGTVGQSAVMRAWNGAAWLEDGLYIWGGGHFDYAGNELYRWRKTDGVFERLTLPTGAIGNTGGLNDGLESSGIYFDGQPRSYHTYNNIAVRNGVLWFFGGAAYYSGNPTSRPFYWNPQSNSWIMDADISVATNFGAVAYDNSRDCFWIFRGGNHQFRQYDPNTKQLTTRGRFNDLNTYCAGFYDEQSDCLIYASETGVIRVIPADMSAVTAVATETNKPSLANLAQRGIAHDTVNRVLYVRGNGADVWRIQIPNNPRTEAFVWELLSASGSLTAPQSAGTFGRFFYAPELNCLGAVDATNQSMHILPLE